MKWASIAIVCGLIIVGTLNRSTPRAGTDAAQLNQAQAGTYEVEGEILQATQNKIQFQQGDHTLELNGVLGENQDTGRGKAVINKSGDSYTLVRWTPIERPQEGQLVDVRTQNNEVYGRIRGYGWVKFDKTIRSIRPQ